jgi:hypothetical protein
MSDSCPAAALPRDHRPHWVAAWLWLACTAFSPIAHAQTPTPPSGRPADAADAADAGVPVPILIYRSPLPATPRAKPVDAGSWRDANDTTARIGGWRAYLREAQTPEPASTLAPSPTPSPMHKH